MRPGHDEKYIGDLDRPHDPREHAARGEDDTRGREREPAERPGEVALRERDASVRVDDAADDRERLASHTA
jgi:hypothetical protein